MATDTLSSLLILALATLPAFSLQSSGGEHRYPPKVQLSVEKADQLLQHSNFVFIGTVMQTQASNLASVPSSPKTSLVRVERVLHGTPFLVESLGQLVTVLSDRSGGHPKGQRGTFFLEIDTFGENLCGFERACFTHEAEDDSGHAQTLSHAKLQGEDRELVSRIRKADQVVRGRVVLVEPAGIEEPRSEHAAHWHRAVIEVASVIKGRPGTKTVTFYFPTSQDQMWKDTPRFLQGQEGVWVLHPKGKDYGRKSLMVPGLTALDHRDFHRSEHVERLQRLASNR